MRILLKLFWVLGFVALLVFAVLVLTRETEEGDDGKIVTEEAEEAEEVEVEKTSMEELEKFLDGEKSEENLEGRVGNSEQEGTALAEVEKKKRELDSEAIDLERYLEEEADTFEKDEDILAEGTTDLNQQVMWKVIGDWVYFRIAFSPYDEVTHQRLQSPEEAIFLSFRDSSGDRVVPASASARIPTQALYVLREKGEKTGWAFSGKLSLAEVDPSRLDHSHVGWIFSNDLHAHLKSLKALRAEDERYKAHKVLHQ